MDEDTLNALLMKYGQGEIDSSDYWANLISTSNACGWGPDVVEDIELSKCDDNNWKFSASIQYANEGPYSDETIALYDTVREDVKGTVSREDADDEWTIEIATSEHVEKGLLVDDEE